MNTGIGYISLINGNDSAVLPCDAPTLGNLASGSVRPVILQVLPAMVSGGVERGTVEVAEAIVAAGGDALVASAGGAMEREIARVGARHITLPLDTKKPWRLHRNANLLTQLILSENVDLVHARSRAPAWSAYWATRRTGCAFVTTLHDAYREGTPPWRYFRHRYNHIMCKGDRVISISDFVTDYAKRLHGVDEARLRTIPRGVDTRIFTPRHTHPNRVAALAGEWRLPDGVPVIMLPGRVSNSKGHAVLIDALHRIGARDLACLAVGDTSRHPRLVRRLQRESAKLPLQPGLLFTGICRDIAAAYMLADIVVVPSARPEAFGRVIIEAQAMGKPVIAAAHGAATQLIVPGQTGWLFPPGDAAALAALLEQILAMPSGERDELSEHTRAHVTRQYSRELLCVRTLQLYCELLNQSKQAQNLSSEGEVSPPVKESRA